MHPMLATAGPLPAGRQWAYEVKWDGIRLLLAAEGGAVRLASRAGNDHTRRWPQLLPLGASLPPGRTVLDGELVAFDPAGRPSFGVLMSSRGGTLTPVTLCLFDVLVVDGEDVRTLPWQERRGLLESLALDGPAWRTPEVFEDGAALFEVTLAQGLEGVVAKRRASTYQAGVRSRDWVKVPHRRTVSLVVGGWQPGGTAGLKSLAVGLPLPEGGLEPLGSVGSGISIAEAQALLAVLRELASPRCPFSSAPALADAQWVEPLLVVDVEHLGHTEGHQLRQAVFVRARPDLTPPDLIADEEG